jgi:hypothetical protein
MRSLSTLLPQNPYKLLEHRLVSLGETNSKVVFGLIWFELEHTLRSKITL